jgi:uncharacterized protein YccT (UPF0319 family)
MKAELRDQLGKAVYEVHRDYLKSEGYGKTPDWENCKEDVKELNSKRGEAAVSEFINMIMPGAQSVITAIVPVLNDEQRANLIAAVESITAMVEE